MADRLTIKSCHGGGVLEFTGSVPRGLQGYDGTNFKATLTGDRLSASVDVYDIQPHNWSKFFRDMARNWRGWQGVKEFESLEGHLKLSGTMDSTGHVELRIHLHGDMSGSDWWAVDTLWLEAGQLEDLAQKASAYFGEG